MRKCVSIEQLFARTPRRARMLTRMKIEVNSYCEAPRVALIAVGDVGAGTATASEIETAVVQHGQTCPSSLAVLWASTGCGRYLAAGESQRDVTP